MFIPLHDANSLKRIRLQYVTLLMIAANVIVWVITATPTLTDASAASSLYFSYGFVPAVVNDVKDLPIHLAVIPEPASYITYAFFHADFMHLAGNMLFLWAFGDNVEDAMGHFRFLVFYLVCAAVAAFAHGLAEPASEAPLIGASGAAAGIVGAYLMLHPNVKVWVLALGRIPLRLSAMWVLGGWIAFQFYSFFADPGSSVSWAAHIGGAVAGVVLIPFFKSRDVPLFDRAATSEKPAPEKNESRKTETASNASSSHPWGRGK